MAETLLFVGKGPDGPTIWTSIWSGFNLSFQPIKATEVVNQLSGSGDALGLPGPILYFFNNKIYAQSQSTNLLVWDTHSSTSTSNWTHDVFNYTGADNQSSVFNPQGFSGYLGGSEPLVYFNGTYQAQNSLTTTGELFSTDGTQQGTKIIPGPVPGLNPSSLAMVFADILGGGQLGQLFFAGYNSSGDNVLFGYDGSAPPAPVFPAGSGVVNPAYLTMSHVGTLSANQIGPITELSPKQSLFMSGQDPQGPTGLTRLYQYDGTNLTGIAPTHGASSSGLQPCHLTEVQWRGSHGSYQSAVFFSGVDNNNNTGLWMSLGTAGPTTEITTPKPHGAPSSGGGLYPFNLTAFNGMLWFTGYDTYIGGIPSKRGLFVCDPASSNEVTELIPSSTANLDPQFNADWEGNGQSAAEGFSLNQSTMTVFDNDLFFSASSESTGGVPNLWRANLQFNSQGTPVVNPQPVAVGGQTGLQPFSLTTVGL